MMQVVGENIEAYPYKEYSVDVAEGQSPVTAEVTLEKDELYNLIDFVEIEFIDSIRKDEEVDNIDYIISMMNALQKLRAGYYQLTAKIKTEESNEDY